MNKRERFLKGYHKWLRRRKIYRLEENNPCYHLRTVAAICSCWMCSGWKKYQRQHFKQQTQKQLEEWKDLSGSGNYDTVVKPE